MRKDINEIGIILRINLLIFMFEINTKAVRNKAKPSTINSVKNNSINPEYKVHTKATIYIDTNETYLMFK